MLSYSIVVETENLANGDLRELLACLDSIRAQEVPVPPAAVLLVNSGQVSAAVIEDLRRRDSGLTVHTVPTPLHYYAAKLEGARIATTDVVVFADTDLHYEKDWLAALLAPFTDPDVAFVTGETRVAIAGPYTFSVATSWLFARRFGHSLAPSLSANNCAVRRDVLLAHPFPHELPLYRAQITVHGRILHQRGFVIRRVAARGWHGEPDGVREWALRYLVSGADTVLAGTWEVRDDGTLSRRNTAWTRARGWAVAVARKLASSVVRTVQAWQEQPATLLYAPLALPISALGLALFVAGGFSAVCGSSAARRAMQGFDLSAGGVR